MKLSNPLHPFILVIILFSGLINAICDTIILSTHMYFAIAHLVMGDIASAKALLTAEKSVLSLRKSRD